MTNSSETPAPEEHALVLPIENAICSNPTCTTCPDLVETGMYAIFDSWFPDGYADTEDNLSIKLGHFEIAREAAREVIKTLEHIIHPE